MKHLLEAAEQDAPEEDLLVRIVSLAEMWKERKKELDEAEKAVKVAKKAFNAVSMEAIPDAMMQAGMSSFKLASGEEVTYTEELSISVKDVDRLIKFLEDRGDDAIVKTTLTLGKVPQNVVNKIMSDLAEDFGLDVEVKSGVHPQTLKSYFSTLFGLKKNTEAKMHINQVSDKMVSKYTFHKTKIK